MQLIEILELYERMKNQDQFMNENLVKLHEKLETLVLMQNDLFERYSNGKVQNKNFIEKCEKTNKNLLEDINDVKRSNKALEETLKILESRNLSAIEAKVIEKMKEFSILEFNFIKLNRKYDALFDEEQKLRNYVDDIEKNSLEKDTNLTNTIIKLKEWKSLLLYYLKFVMKKLKNSVSKSEFDRVLDENKNLREKQHEMVIRDINVTKKISQIENYKIRVKELEQSFYNSEEMRIDSEIEINLLKRKLQSLNPNYMLTEQAFRKFLKLLSEHKFSFSEVKKIFDQNGNGSISKDEFEHAVKNLNFNFDKNEINLIIESILGDMYSSSENSKNEIDLDYFIRKLERSGMEEMKQDEIVLNSFIEGVKNSNLDLKTVFEMVDTSGDGFISKEEFKFALQNLHLNISEAALNKLIFIISGDSEETDLTNMDDVFGKLKNENKNGLINYNQFCEVFDARSNLINVKNKKNNQVRNALKIDWKTNLYADIVESIKKNGLELFQAYELIDPSHSGKINKVDLSKFLRRISVNFGSTEIDELFNLLDSDKNGSISADEFYGALKECEEKIKLFKRVVNTNSKLEDEKNVDITLKYSIGKESSNNTNNKLEHKCEMLQKRERFYSYKIDQMITRLKAAEKSNEEMNFKLEEHMKDHLKVADKYFNTSEEMMKLKTIYETSVTKEQFRLIESENDVLAREVNVLRVGLNTFKDLYNSSNRQNISINLRNARDKDELETYKKAIKELQAESNSQNLIGKLYYSLLISRWREASTIRKYDDFIEDLASLRESTFKLESENKVLHKEITELQTITHDKIIENIRLGDIVDNYTNPLVTINQLEELKLLIRDLSNDKSEITEKYFNTRKENLKISNENSEIKNKIEYAELLSRNIKYAKNNDEATSKIIQMSEQISKSNLNIGTLQRENVMLRETESYLNKLVEHNKINVVNLEQTTADWERKYRTAEEVWRRKDQERQKKLFDQLNSLNLTEFKLMSSKLNLLIFNI